MSDTRLFAYRQAIADTIKAAIPDLKTCEALASKFDPDELKSRSIRCPAVYVVLSRTTLKRTAGSDLAGEANVAVFTITKGKEEEREKEAFLIGETVAHLANTRQMWGLTHIGAPDGMEIEQAQAKVFDKAGTAVVVTSFKQRVSRIGEALMNENGTVTLAVSVNGDEINA